MATPKTAAPKPATKQPTKTAPKRPAKTATKQAPKTATKQATKTAPKRPTKTAPKQATKTAPKQAAKQAAKTASKQAPKPAAKTAPKQAKTAPKPSQATPTKAPSADDVRGVALLRGINLNGRNALSMPALKRMVEDAGGRDVVTYIASGNVVFTMPRAQFATLHDVLEARIWADTAMKVPIVLRTQAQLQAVVAHPELQHEPEGKKLYVMFLSTTPTKEQVAALDPNRSPGDRFVVDGGEIYLCLGSAADTKITNAWIDKALSTTSTSRNLNTTRKLLALCAGG